MLIICAILPKPIATLLMYMMQYLKLAVSEQEALKCCNIERKAPLYLAFAFGIYVQRYQGDLHIFASCHVSPQAPAIHISHQPCNIVYHPVKERPFSRLSDSRTQFVRLISAFGF